MTHATDTRAAQAAENPISKLWSNLSGSALKRGAFSAVYALKAPYFRTSSPLFAEAFPASPS